VGSNFTSLIVGTYPMQVKDSRGCLSAVKNAAVGNDCPVTQPLIQLQPTQLIPIVITRVAPNPAVDELRLEVNSLSKREQQFEFFDVNGKAILSEKRQLDSGFNRISFDISSLPTGEYFIQTPGVSEGRNQPRRFMKVN
jgi:hypothetical protein